LWSLNPEREKKEEEEKKKEIGTRRNIEGPEECRPESH